jgi:prolyl oligopeptidase
VKIRKMPKWIVKEQLWAQSKDETAVPVHVYRPKGKGLDGKTPMVLVGYGGFDIDFLQRSSVYGALAELGIAVGVMGLRGGSEQGESWHQDGMGKKKQHTFDDAIAIAEMLVARKYTDPSRLGILGASNGGLLVGAVVTQRPDLFRAAVSQVGLLDMVRFPRFRIGRLWISEYGDPEDPAEFKWIWPYSPYHHVKEGTAYPAIMLTATENDPRVDPLHARKMAAMLQWANTSDRPILLKLDATGGHGVGQGFRRRVDEMTDIVAFFLDQFGVVADQ